MKDKITFVQYGCGKMGRHTAAYAMEKGAKLVAAFDMNPAIVGKDFGEVIGRGKMGGLYMLPKAQTKSLEN